MKKPAPRGVAGPWFVICLAALGAGLAFEFGAPSQSAFWIGAQAGASAAIGAGAALFVVIASLLARALFARRGDTRP
jgi:hypothetical protein